MPGGDVLLLDDDADLRETLGELVGLLSGRRCIGVGSFAELTAARERVLGCDLAILDINLGDGQPTGFCAYDWLRTQRFGGRILFSPATPRTIPSPAAPPRSTASPSSSSRSASPSCATCWAATPPRGERVEPKNGCERPAAQPTSRRAVRGGASPAAASTSSSSSSPTSSRTPAAAP